MLDSDLHGRALARAPYANDRAVGEATRSLAALGRRIFQIYLLAENEREHVLRLLELLAPGRGARILDAGCGIGGVAETMRQARPDLEFVLLNLSREQLALCPGTMARVAASFEALPLRENSFDAVMLLYSIGHGRLDRVFPECARILRHGGVLFIYDLAAAAERDAIQFADRLGYVVRSPAAILSAAASSRFAIERATVGMRATPAAFEALVGRELALSLLRGISPALYRFRRC